MDSQDFILDREMVTVQAKCSLFGSKEFVYFYVNYSSKAEWFLSTDTPFFNPNCKCYNKNLDELFPHEIVKAKNEILARIRNQHLINRINEKSEAKKSWLPTQTKPINLMKHKDIRIKDIDWRD